MVTTGSKTKMNGKEAIGKEVYLDDKDATRFRSGVARCNYLAADRPDIQYATKEVARGMSKPTQGLWDQLVHLARYLAGHRGVAQWFEWQGPELNVTGFSDSDWAGCRSTRKSSSGGGIRIGSHLVKSLARTQSTIATSSGEAELYAACKGASELIGIQALAKDFGRLLAAELRVDAKATIGMVNRAGLGKLRHVDVGHLWIQQAVRSGRISVKKVLGTENIADLMTKYLDGPASSKHMVAMGFDMKAS